MRIIKFLIITLYCLELIRKDLKNQGINLADSKYEK